MKISMLPLLITAATVAVACSESPTSTEDPVRAFAKGGKGKPPSDPPSVDGEVTFISGVVFNSDDGEPDGGGPR